MKAMILAAGKGTRLRPLTEQLPKCMVRVQGKPILDHTIEWLKKYKVRDLIINLHHFPRVISDYFGDGKERGVRITYSFEPEVLGTAGAVRKVRECFEDAFFLWYGDNLSTCDLRQLYRFHRAKGGIATVALFRREDVSQSGIAELNAGKRVTRFLEKPRPHESFSRLVNAGIMVLEPRIFEFIPESGRPDFGHDVFPALLASGEAIFGYEMLGGEGLWWIDTPDDLRRVQGEWSKGGENDPR